MTTTIRNNEKLLEGFFTVCDAVAETMGAQGRLAIIENDIMGNPIITKDGISTAKEIYFEDKAKNMGARMAKQVAAQTLVVAGDSTTTSLVLSRAFIQNTAIENKRTVWDIISGTSTSTKQPKYFYNKRVERGIEKGYNEVLKHLDELSKPVDEVSLKNIARISSNNNDEIANLVYKAHSIVGQDGIIDVFQTNASVESYVTDAQGMKLSNGWANPFLINNQKTAKFEADDCVIVCYEGTLGGDTIIQSAIQEYSDKPILLLAERFHEDTLIKITELNQRGTLNITAVQCPDYDNKRKALLEDVALYTGAEVFLQGSSSEVVVGFASKVVVDESSCSFMQKEINKDTLNRIEELKGQLGNVSDRNFIQKRIQNLEGKSATIFVGGSNPTEAKERFDRVEDSVASVASAQKEGWVAGGGSTFVYISTLLNTTFLDEEEQFGYSVLKRTLCSPFEQICRNANRNGKEYIDSSKKQYGYGYNAYTDSVGNLVKEGVIDSKKSLRVALENAKSICVLLMNTSVVITK